MLFESSHSPVILELPWLWQHNPQIDWQAKNHLPPWGPGAFFVIKEDGWLRPCIDYRG